MCAPLTKYSADKEETDNSWLRDIEYIWGGTLLTCALREMTNAVLFKAGFKRIGGTHRLFLLALVSS